MNISEHPGFQAIKHARELIGHAPDFLLEEACELAAKGKIEEAELISKSYRPKTVDEKYSALFDGVTIPKEPLNPALLVGVDPSKEDLWDAIGISIERKDQLVSQLALITAAVVSGECDCEECKKERIEKGLPSESYDLPNALTDITKIANTPAEMLLMAYAFGCRITKEEHQTSGMGALAKLLKNIEPA